MATHRTTDHDAIRKWILEHGGEPAIIRNTSDEETPGVLTLVFGTADHPEVELITWDEFFGMFDSEDMRFKYDSAAKREDARWAYAFERKGMAMDSSAESGSEFVEDRKDFEENVYSAERAKGDTRIPPDETQTHE